METNENCASHTNIGCFLRPECSAFFDALNGLLQNVKFYRIRILKHVRPQFPALFTTFVLCFLIDFFAWIWNIDLSFQNCLNRFHVALLDSECNAEAMTATLLSSTKLAIGAPPVSFNFASERLCVRAPLSRTVPVTSDKVALFMQQLGKISALLFHFRLSVPICICTVSHFRGVRSWILATSLLYTFMTLRWFVQNFCGYSLLFSHV